MIKKIAKRSMTPNASWSAKFVLATGIARMLIATSIQSVQAESRTNKGTSAAASCVRDQRWNWRGKFSAKTIKPTVPMFWITS